MISFEEAYKTVIDSAFKTGTEKIHFPDSLNRILAEDIKSDMDMPPFNRAAVDGYACRKGDLKNDLEIIEVIAAGKAPVKIAGDRQCFKIMTGAIVPDGCDIVFMVEDSEIVSSGKVRFTGKDSKVNISFRGEDIKTGDLVLRSGKLIRPQDIAVVMHQFKQLDHCRREDLGQGGLEYARKELSVDAFVESYLKLFRDLHNHT